MHSLVKDLMTTKVVTVAPSTPFKEIVARLAEHRVSAVPVVDEGGRVLGVVSEADLLLKEEFPDPDQDAPLFWTRRRRLQREKAAGSTARELMTGTVATISPEATVPEAARRMHTDGVKRLPVVDGDGRLLGIISRADLLKVFLRADADIATEVRQQVLRRTLAIDPDTIRVEVRDGVVTLEGQLERASLIPILVGLVHGLDGVVDVVDRLSFETDDTPIMVPSDLLIDRAATVRRRI